MRVRDAIAQPFKVIYEALTGSAMGQAYASADDAENRGFRPLSDRFAPTMRRDLSLMSHAQMLKMAHYLFTSNPLAKFLVNIPTAVVLGRRVDYCLEFKGDQLGWSKERVDAEEARANAFLQPWWNHPAHDYGGRALQYARTYLITGELPLIVTAVNPVSGLFQTDYVDSALIKGVLGLNQLSTVPGTVLIQAEASGSDPKSYPVCREDFFGGQDSIIFFKSAERLNSMRGFSYLLDVGDWIDSHDQSFFGQVDRSILGNALLHDIEIKGADATKITTEVENFRRAAAKPGGIFGHNENIKHEVKTPNLTQADSAEFVRALRVFILGSKGIPEHWYGSGENSNRASAGEQNDIALKIMESFQDELAGIFRLLLILGYDQLAQAQGFPKRSDGVAIYPKMPKISERDISRIGGVFGQTEAALDSAVAGERLSNQTARKIIYALTEKITGEPVDGFDEASKIEAEKSEREKKAQDSARASADRLAVAAKDQDEDNSDGPDDVK